MDKKINALIVIDITRKDFLTTYTLRARIGIYIGILIGLVELNFISKE